MKTPIKIILIIVFSVFLVTSCSRKKNNFVSRNYHAIKTRYNILYNGYLALEEGKKTLNDNYTDNYWDILPIERMQIQGNILNSEESKNQNFSRAEEKAIKAIQKHSINIKGREKNPQMDEAYLLLGKARYFDQRFVPALAAFNTILNKYPTSDKINQVKIWREKSNIRLDNNQVAIEKLKRLLREEQLKDQDLADATSILAQAYLNTKSIDSAITQLEIAANATKNNDERGRYRFIQGQLFNKLGYKDSANIAFDKVIELKRKIPRIYMISAEIEKIKNFDFNTGDKHLLIEKLTKLEKNRENRPYLDKIYYQIAKYHLTNHSDSLAILYYNKSLKTNSKNKLLNAKSYQTLGHINFDKSQYETAGYYYDSTLTNLVLNSKPYRIIKRKRDHLEDVIYYENIARVNDSILHLVYLPKNERLTYFKFFVDSLKVEDKKNKERKEAEKRKKGLATVNTSNKKLQKNKTSKQSNTFYFYNPTTVAYGKSEFIKIWGDRTLKDNWKWFNKITSITLKNTLNKNDSISVSNKERLDPQFYISKIPSEKKVIDSISKERNFAYYQLGLIYKEKFKEYHLSKNKLQELLKSNPEDRLILPAKYHLYKVYELLGKTNDASIAKTDIITNHPKSRYASILKNPGIASLNDENSPENIYKWVYKQYENQEYLTVILECENAINIFESDPIVPKFELLKATATVKLYGFEAYKKAINYIALTYANTIEGKEAQKIESELLPKIKNTSFIKDSNDDSKHYKVVYTFKNSSPKEIKTFNASLNTIVRKIKYHKLKTSVDIYAPNTWFVVVHGFKNAQIAKTFDQLLTKEDLQKITKPYFTISSKNYLTIQTHKNLNLYLDTSTN